MHVSLFIVDGE